MQKLPDLVAAPENAPGLLWAYAGTANGAAVRLSASEIEPALARSDWIWVHIDLIDQRTRGWVARTCRLADDAATSLASRDAGFSFARDGDGIHGVCADLNVDFLRVSDSVGQFTFAVSDRLIVTGQRHPLAGVGEVRGAARDGARFASGYAILGAIAAAFCRIAFARLRGAEIDLDRVEDQLLATNAPDERTALKEVRRLALALHRPVSTMLVALRDEVAEDEEAEAPGPVHSAAEATLAEMGARFSQLDEAVRSIGDRAKLLQEEIAAELADESNRSLRALTVMTAIPMPGTLVAGIFGMNTGGLPLTDSPLGSFGAMVLGGVATLLFYRVLVRAGASLL